MFQLLIILTGLVIVVMAFRSYRRTHDPLSPGIVFAPMLLFIYAYNPMMLSRQEDLYDFLTEGQLLYVQFLNLCGVTMFMAGCVAFGRLPWRPSKAALNQAMQVDVAPRGRQTLFRLACLMGVIGTGSFLYCVEYSGGWMRLFSEGKPYIGGPSGYISEAWLMCYPALVLLGLSLQGRPLRVKYLALAFFIALPHLTVAIVGGRRGPAFLIIATLALSWFLYKGKRPKVRTVVIGVILLGLTMLFLGANRQDMHLGGDFDVGQSLQTLVERVTQQKAARGNEYVAAAGRVIAADYYSSYDWGKRYMVLIFIRPIPRFLWPTKWKDVGMGHKVTDPGRAGLSEHEWIEAAGFIPTAGSTGSFISDLYASFCWLALLACYLLGRLYAVCWRRFVAIGGVWTIIYIELLALSVYLPAQSIGAWLYRCMLLVIPTVLLWRLVVAGRRGRSANASRQPAVGTAAVSSGGKW